MGSKAVWDDGSWRDGAACRDIKTEHFFPIGVTGEAVGHIDAAKRVCAGCEVREDCLWFAVTTNQEYGVWGGLDEDERRAVRRRWRAGQRVASAAS